MVMPTGVGVNIPTAPCQHVRCSIRDAALAGIIPADLANTINNSGAFTTDETVQDFAQRSRPSPPAPERMSNYLRGALEFIAKQLDEKPGEGPGKAGFGKSVAQDFAENDRSFPGLSEVPGPGTARTTSYPGEPANVEQLTVDDPHDQSPGGVSQFYTEKERLFLAYLGDLKERPFAGEAPQNMLTRPRVVLDDGTLMLLKDAFMAGWTRCGRKLTEAAERTTWEL